MNKNCLFLTLTMLLAGCACEKQKSIEKDGVEKVGKPTTATIPDVQKTEQSTTTTVKEISDSKELRDHDKAIVKFYGEWCGACKMSAKPFAELKEQYPDVSFFSVNVDKDGDLKEKHSIKFLPTFIIFEKGKNIDSLVGFNPEKIKGALDKLGSKKAAVVPSKIAKVKDKKEFEKEVKDHKNVIVKFYGDWCGFCKMIAPDYEELSKEYGDKVKFLEVELSSNQELAKEYDIQGVPMFISFKKGTKKDIVSGANKEQLKETVKKLADE